MLCALGAYVCTGTRVGLRELLSILALPRELGVPLVIYYSSYSTQKTISINYVGNIDCGSHGSVSLFWTGGCARGVGFRVWGLSTPFFHRGSGSILPLLSKECMNGKDMETPVL